MHPLRRHGHPAGHDHQASDACALRAPAHHPAAAHPPLHVHRVWKVLARRHQQGGTRTGQADPHRPGLGATGPGAGPPERQPGCGDPRGLVEHRQHRHSGQGPTQVDQGHHPVRDGVTVLGVDERVWHHTRRGDKYVTVIIDHTPIKDRTGPARLLGMAPCRSKKTFKEWLIGRPAAWRERVEVVAMDGSTGFKAATIEELPKAVAVMDPFHVIHLTAQALQECRHRSSRTVTGAGVRPVTPCSKAGGCC